MIDEIEATLSGYFFPTDQYKHNFDDAKFLEFRKDKLSKFINIDAEQICAMYAD